MCQRSINQAGIPIQQSHEFSWLPSEYESSKKVHPKAKSKESTERRKFHIHLSWLIHVCFISLRILWNRTYLQFSIFHFRFQNKRGLWATSDFRLFIVSIKGKEHQYSVQIIVVINIIVFLPLMGSKSK